MSNTSRLSRAIYWEEKGRAEERPEGFSRCRRKLFLLSTVCGRVHLLAATYHSSVLNRSAKHFPCKFSAMCAMAHLIESCRSIQIDFLLKIFLNEFADSCPGFALCGSFYLPGGPCLSPIRGNEHKVGVNFTAGKSLPGRRHLLQCTTYE